MSISGRLVTHVEIWKVKVNELFHKLQNAFTRGWDPGDVGTFIEGIHNKVDWTLFREREHFFQALHQSIITWL